MRKPHAAIAVFSVFPVIAVVLGVSLSSCFGGKAEQAAGTAGGKPPAARKLNLAIWSNYVSKELLDSFTRRTGIEVAVTNYSSNEELLAKLQAGASGYDVVVPSDYMVFALVQLKLLAKLDRSKLPNAKGLDPRLLAKQFDPANDYSLPHNWGSTGIAVNREKFKGPIPGWKQLLTSPELAGKFTLLDDVRETMGAALKSLGHSLNSRSDAELAAAKAVLMSARERVKGFTSEPMAALVSGETPIAHAYMSDALQARRETGGKIEYVIPEEGGTLYVDNWCIPAKAEHPAEAHEFIDAMLDPRAVAETVKAVLVAPASPAALALLPEDIRTNKQLFLPEATLKRLEMIEDLGDGLAKYDRIWTEIKTR